MLVAPSLLAPSAERTARIDQNLRDRLAASLDYLADFLATDDWNPAGAMAEAGQRLRAGPVQPWVFGFYARIVQFTSKGDHTAARADFDRMIAAINGPVARTFVGLGDAALSDAHRAVAQLLFDTDPKRPFRPVPPTPDQTARIIAGIDAAYTLLTSAAPAFAAEMRVLQQVFLFGVPSGPDDPGQFGAASTFFLWQAVILNAEPRRGVIGMVDVLVHEASHLLLFGLVGGGALSTNDPLALYASPLRRDPRPIDGIFHAAFVATRVHMAMTLLGQSAEPALVKDIVACSARNGDAARRAIDILTRELQPTPAGAEIYDALLAYWQTAETGPLE